VPLPLPPDLFRRYVHHAALLLGGLVALALLLVDAHGVWGTLLTAATGAIVLWPLRRYGAGKALLAAGGLLLGMALIGPLGKVLLPFLGVLGLAYLLNPAVTAAQTRWNVPRWASAMALTGLAVGLAVLLVVLLVPQLIDQVQALAAQVVTWLADAPAWIEGSEFMARLEGSGLIQRAAVEEKLTTLLPDQIAGIAEQLPAALGEITARVGTVLEAITIATILPVLLYYALKDFPLIREEFVRLFPKWKGDRVYVSRTVAIVGGYLRGQLIIAAIAGFNISVGLVLFDVPFALLIGVAAGLLSLVPNVGAVITNVLAIGLTLAAGTLGDVAVVAGVIFAQQMLESAVLTPNVMRQQVGLHPILVIMSLLVFGVLFGAIGLLIAVPVAAVLVAAYQSYRESVAAEHPEVAPAVYQTQPDRASQA
jgi:predicted PurR-regulated permease PerM